MANLSLRGVDPEVLDSLKKQAVSEGSSVNAVILRLIEQGVGKVAKKPSKQRYGDLDSLAGAWSNEEASEFAMATQSFESIDAALWK